MQLTAALLGGILAISFAHPIELPLWNGKSVEVYGECFPHSPRGYYPVTEPDIRWWVVSAGPEFARLGSSLVKW